jgi:hypothetical protein
MAIPRARRASSFAAPNLVYSSCARAGGAGVPCKDELAGLIEDATQIVAACAVVQLSLSQAA